MPPAWVLAAPNENHPFGEKLFATRHRKNSFHNLLMRKLFYLLLSVVAITSCNEDPIAPKPVVAIDGKDYATATIGTQTWTIENYEGAGGVFYNATHDKPEYGKYYLKSELASIPLPEGWRLPTRQDYEKLAAFYGLTIPTKMAESEAVKNLVSVSGWNHVAGTNKSGFNAYPGGYIFGEGVPLDGDIAEFWAAEGFSFSIQEAGENLSSLRIGMYDSNNSPDYRFNVRFVKD